MIKIKKIKAESASLIFSSNKIPIVCIESEKSIECYCPESINQLGDAIKTKKISVKKWLLSLPRNLSIQKELSLPASDINEAYNMIEFELPSLVPMVLNEIVYGCSILNKQENLLNISVSIVKQQLLNQFLKDYEEIHIKPQKILPETLALQNWFNTMAGFSSGFCLGICVSRHNYHIITFCEGTIQEINQSDLSTEDISISSMQIVKQILSQACQSIYSDVKGKKIVIAGAQQYALAIQNLLQQDSMNFASYEINILPSPSISCYGSENSEDALENFSYETIIAAGLLKLSSEPKIKYSNLLPQKDIKKAHRKILLLNYLFTSALAISLILLLWLSFAFMNWRIERHSLEIQSQIMPMENIVGSVDSKRQRVQALRKQLSNRALITRTFKELYHHTPNTISISELKFNSDTKGVHVDIKGQADSLSDAFGYTETVAKSDLLREMQISNAQQVPRTGGSIVEFRASCLIRTD